MDEQIKYEVIKSLADHPDGNKDRAALTLGCSKRHINRMLAGYKKYGKEFFVHGNKGRKPATTIPDETRRSIVDLYRTKYYDAIFRHFSELLEKHEQITISPSSVANILESEYILSPKGNKSQEKADQKRAGKQKESCQKPKGSGYHTSQSDRRRRCSGMECGFMLSIF